MDTEFSLLIQGQYKGHAKGSKIHGTISVKKQERRQVCYERYPKSA